MDRSRKDLAVDWDRLQQPEYSADFIGHTYAPLYISYGQDDWEPTADALALLHNNQPLLGYIGGREERFTSMDHNFTAGHTVRKQLILLNNARRQIVCDASWSLNLPVPISGTERVEFATGEQSRIPIELHLPRDLNRATTT